MAVAGIHEALLFGMSLEPTAFQSLWYGELDLPCLRFRSTMNHNIVCISLEWAARELHGHPGIEHVMQEDVCEKRRDHATLWCATIPRLRRPIAGLNRGRQPSLRVAQNPRTAPTASNADLPGR